MNLDPLNFSSVSLPPTIVYYLRRLLSRNLDRLIPIDLNPSSKTQLVLDPLRDLNQILSDQYPQTHDRNLILQKLERLVLYHQALSHQGTQHRQEMEATEIEIFRALGYAIGAVAETDQGKILIVDDRPENVRLLTVALKRQGYQSIVATSGTEALKLVKQAPTDLILLDIMMPIMDGYEVCKKLKADPETADIPIIFVSALNNVIDKLKAFRLGGVDYLARPFDYEEILTRIEYQIRIQDLKKRLEDQNVKYQAEIHQHQSHHHLFQLTQKAFETMGDYVLLSDATSQIVYATASASQILGYSPQDLLSLSLWDLDPKLNLATWSRLWEQLKQQDICTIGQAQHLTRSGALIPISAKMSCFAMGQQQYSCLVVKQV